MVATADPGTSAWPVAAATLLAFNAGLVDTLGFIALFSLFTAHVTGNFVVIGATIAEHHGGVLGKLLALPTFILAVAATHLYVRRCERLGAKAARPVIASQLAFLALFLAAGLAAAPLTDADAPLAVLTGLLGVTAMAIQNAAGRSLFSHLAPTTVMTGNVTQIVVDLVDLGRRPPGFDQTRAAEAGGRLRKMAPAVLAFAAGAVAAAFGYLLAGFWCLLLPMATTAVLLLRPFARH